MKVSNIVFSSNIYVLREAGKLSDSRFMEHVVDPGAINAIADHQRKINGVVRLAPLQEKIRNGVINCALASGDCTHGVIFEKGEYQCVNKCENYECSHFSRCKKDIHYRPVVRDADATFEFKVPEQESTALEVSFDIQLPIEKAPMTIRVHKLGGKTFKLPQPKLEIEEIIRYAHTDNWSVRPHQRHLPDGTITWVRGHTRGHLSDRNVTYILKDNRVKLNLSKPYIDVKRIKKLLERTANRPIEAAIAPQIYQLQNIHPIDSAEPIIKSSLDSKLLVNAGPGTGKTHTVIERLKYIVANMDEEIAPDDVLVLCFSRSAVKVVRDRLSQAMERREIPYIAKRYNISTFDSFATWYLKQIEPNFDLVHLNYDERIERFIDKYTANPEILNGAVGYLIIDEVQDLVGVRARLVQALLKNLECGFLLLGDECQAIYDYQIEDERELNAAKLYQWLEAYFKEDLLEYELTRDWRHPGEIAESFKPLRYAMQFEEFSRQKKELKHLFKKYDIPGMSVEDIVHCCEEDAQKQHAVLSWANGDAYRQSYELYARTDITAKHTILTGSRRLMYRKELAGILGHYTNNAITQARFFEIGQQLGYSELCLAKLWQGLLYVLEQEEDEVINIPKLKTALLSERRVDEALLVQDDANVVISTIHKAKGREYDTVILNQFGGISNGDDIKVYYVALTRAKQELIVKSQSGGKTKDIKTPSGRFIELSSTNKIRRVELGVDGDIDNLGFVSKKLPELNPAQRQEYIINNVRVGDPIKISKYKGEYLIFHNGHCIGRLNHNAIKNYRHFYPSGRSNTYRLEEYTDFDELFVKDIVTIINQRLDIEIEEPYNKSGFWYGIEFCGYAKPMEE